MSSMIEKQKVERMIQDYMLLQDDLLRAGSITPVDRIAVNNVLSSLNYEINTSTQEELLDDATLARKNNPSSHPLLASSKICSYCGKSITLSSLCSDCTKTLESAEKSIIPQIPTPSPINKNLRQKDPLQAITSVILVASIINLLVTAYFILLNYGFIK